MAADKQIAAAEAQSQNQFRREQAQDAYKQFIADYHAFKDAHRAIDFGNPSVPLDLAEVDEKVAKLDAAYFKITDDLSSMTLVGSSKATDAAWSLYKLELTGAPIAAESVPVQLRRGQSETEVRASFIRLHSPNFDGNDQLLREFIAAAREDLEIPAS